MSKKLSKECIFYKKLCQFRYDLSFKKTHELSNLELLYIQGLS